MNSWAAATSINTKMTDVAGAMPEDERRTARAHLHDLAGAPLACRVSRLPPPRACVGLLRASLASSRLSPACAAASVPGRPRLRGSCRRPRAGCDGRARRESPRLTWAPPALAAVGDRAELFAARPAVGAAGGCRHRRKRRNWDLPAGLGAPAARPEPEPAPRAGNRPCRRPAELARHRAAAAGQTRRRHQASRAADPVAGRRAIPGRPAWQVLTAQRRRAVGSAQQRLRPRPAAAQPGHRELVTPGPGPPAEPPAVSGAAAALLRAAWCSAAAAERRRPAWVCRPPPSYRPDPGPGGRCPWSGSCPACGPPRPAPARTPPRAHRVPAPPSAAAASGSVSRAWLNW